jgi:hypothetical protein
MHAPTAHSYCRLLVVLAMYLLEEIGPLVIYFVDTRVILCSLTSSGDYYWFP